MNHYDGPAFYRKFAGRTEPKQRRTPNESERSTSPFKREEGSVKKTPATNPTSVNKRAQLTPKVADQTKTSGTTAKTRGELTEDAANYTRPFTPTKIPAQLVTKPRIKRPEIGYQSLVRHLHKPDDQVLLFDFNTVISEQPQSTLTFAPTVDEQSETGTPVASNEQPTTLELDATPLNQQAELILPDEDEVTRLATSLAAQTPKEATGTTSESLSNEIVSPTDDQTQPVECEEETEESVSDVSSDQTVVDEPIVESQSVAYATEESEIAAATPIIGEGEQSDSTTTLSGDLDVSESMILGQKSETVETNEPTTKPESSSASKQPKARIHAAKSVKPRGLGHGLGDIMSDEENDQRDLALFNRESDQPDIVEQPQPALREDGHGYEFPGIDLLTPPVTQDDDQMDDWIEHQVDILDQTLSAFNVKAEVSDWTIGPTVTQFQIHLALGVKVNKITNLMDDLKLALAAKDIRIEAPIPGKSTVGIEIPNPKARPVMLSEVVNTPKFQESESPLTIALGVDLNGEPQITDLRKMPHGLIAGATGSGKSVFINSLLLSILYKATPQQVKLLLIDPKAVEMAPYNGIPHLIAPVISDSRTASAALKWAAKEMDQRYERLAAAGVRKIEQFNDRADANDEPGLKMPYIVIIIDELADLMMEATSEVQDYIARITQKARAAGIHLIVATQRPSVDVITGMIKNNIPTRIAFMVSSQVDSRTILDQGGAERLLGRGDMLYMGNGSSQAVRLQGAYADDEVDLITNFVRTQGKPQYAFSPKSLLEHETEVENQDELFPEVLQFIADEDTVSTSKLQRIFSIGYNRAAKLIDDLEKHGYVSAQQGSKPRDVYFESADLAELQQSAPHQSEKSSF